MKPTPPLRLPWLKPPSNHTEAEMTELSKGQVWVPRPRGRDLDWTQTPTRTIKTLANGRVFWDAVLIKYPVRLDATPQEFRAWIERTGAYLAAEQPV